MKTAYICKTLGQVKLALDDIPERSRYISLMDNHASSEIQDYLTPIPKTKELSRERLLRERSANFREKYIEFVGKLNELNHSLYWWTLRLSDKGHLVPDLCRNTAYFLLIVELISTSETPLIIITDNAELAGQVKQWGLAKTVPVTSYVAVPKTWKFILRTYTPAGTLNAFVKNLLYWWLCRRYKPAKNMTDDHFVITTCTHPRSFRSDNSYQDAYFGTLVDHHATLKVNPIIFAWILEKPLYQLRKLQSLKSSLPIVPIESCLTLKSITICLFRSMALYIRPLQLNGEAQIDNVDLSYLVKKSINRSHQSGDFFWSLRNYYCSMELARTIRVTRCLYPYENLVREKMLLLGIRNVTPEPKMIGYQHAAVSRGHTNFILREEESKINPLPEMILTTGEIIKDWLEKEGNYPPGMFKTACGLRQSRHSGSADRTSLRPQIIPIRKVLAVFGSLQEYVSALSFLDKSFSGQNRCDVRIRPHPTTPLDSALQIASLSRKDFFTISEDTLAQDMRWADVVVYSSSTVAIEALSLGIPIIYMDLGDYVDADPLFGLNEFKWAVSEPTDMVATIRKIESLSTDDFEKFQEMGQRYALEYLRPVTENDVRTFLEV